MPNQFILHWFLTSILEAGLCPVAFIADWPCRALVKGQQAQGAKFACPYCEASATRYASDDEEEAEEEDDTRSRRHTKLTWCSETRGQRPRTHDRWMKQVMDIFFDAELPPNFVGVKEHTSLNQLQDFDVITDVPSEVMHLCDQGR